MSPPEEVQRRYDHDAMFHAFVDAIYAGIVNLQLTPSEMREAAMFACIRVEERRPHPRVTILDPIFRKR